ncbi:MAG: type II toxin-antitoxin system Phd/YefM family antitoxin [Wenzhouxiangella sp.]
MKSVPVYEAKNHLSELLAAVERGESIAITRRGRQVARLVGFHESGQVRAERVEEALAMLGKLRRGSLLDGDLKEIARAGLD